MVEQRLRHGPERGIVTAEEEDVLGTMGVRHLDLLRSGQGTRLESGGDGSVTGACAGGGPQRLAAAFFLPLPLTAFLPSPSPVLGSETAATYP